MFEDDVNSEPFEPKQCNDPECGCRGDNSDFDPENWEEVESWVQVGKGSRAVSGDPRDHGPSKGMANRPVQPD